MVRSVASIESSHRRTERAIFDRLVGPLWKTTLPAGDFSRAWASRRLGKVLLVVLVSFGLCLRAIQRSAAINLVVTDPPGTTPQRLEPADWPPVATLDRIADEKLRLVVIPVNCGYIDFADNLVASMVPFNVTNFVFVPYDDIAYQVLLLAYPDNVIPPMPAEMVVQKGIVTPGVAVYGSENFLDMNRNRPNLLRRFVDHTWTILYTDADTVWRRNLLDAFDMARSGNESEQPAVETILTFDNDNFNHNNICSCVIYITPTKDNIIFLKAWNDGWTSEREDDQVVLNRVMADYQQRFSYRILGKSDNVLSGKQYFEEVTAEEQQRAWLVHNNWIKGKSEKRTRFDNATLWNPSGRLAGVQYDCDAGIVSRVVV